MSFLPTLITDAIVRIEGSEEIVGIATITLPDMENKTEEISGLGMGNYEEVVIGLQSAMSVTLKFRGMSKNTLKTRGKPINLVAVAVLQGRDGQTHDVMTQKLVVSMKGQIKSSKEGELSKGGKVEPERVLSLTYYKLEIDGEVQNEIDVFNRKVVIDGEDVLAAINTMLGS
jgi:P2 family phage contractile tail tube protein